MTILRISDLDGSHDPTNAVADKLDMLRAFESHILSKPRDVRARGIHATEVIQCLRKTYYTLQGERKVASHTVATQKRFDHGHAVHAWIQQELHRMSRATGLFTFEEEVPTITTHLGSQYGITSSCDGILTLADREGKATHRIALEIKSASPDSFATLRGPKEEHILQAHVYMLCLDVPLVWFLYVNKGNENMTPMRAPWLMRYDPEIGARLLKRIDEVYHAHKAQSIPEREPHPYCRDCSYAHVCEPPHVKGEWSGTRTPPKAFTTDPRKSSKS